MYFAKIKKCVCFVLLIQSFWGFLIREGACPLALKDIFPKNGKPIYSVINEIIVGFGWGCEDVKWSEKK